MQGRGRHGGKGRAGMVGGGAHVMLGAGHPTEDESPQLTKRLVGAATDDRDRLKHDGTIVHQLALAQVALRWTRIQTRHASLQAGHVLAELFEQ